MALDDKQIRKALLGELSKDAELEIYQEFLLPSSKARADIVTVGEIFTGYEIKSWREIFFKNKRLYPRILGNYCYI